VVVLVAGDTPVRPDADAVEQVGIERAGLGDGSEGQRNDDFLAAVDIGAWKSKNVVEIGGAYVDIGKNRINRIGIVVVSHCVSPLTGAGIQQLQSISIPANALGCKKTWMQGKGTIGTPPEPPRIVSTSRASSRVKRRACSQHGTCKNTFGLP
jgi:hypothetical protein